MTTSERIDLRAGPVSLVFDAGDLRSLRVAGHEIVRRIYVAVRDPNWKTVPAILSNLRIEQGPDSFRIEYDAAHRDAPIAFDWHATIEGNADGLIRFNMAGAAHSTFLRNRIGICILHPMQCAGAACIVKHVGGATEYGAFPVAITPHQPFRNIRNITHQVVGDLWAEVQLSGDVFEMEDQRNWTDASYKTYSTPLDLPYPVEIAAGTPIEQQVFVALRGPIPDDAIDRSRLTFTLDSPSGRRLPRIGLGSSSDRLPLAPADLARLRSLALAHLRVDLHLGDPAYVADLRRVTSEAIELGVGLEVAVFVSDSAEHELASLAEVVDNLHPPVYAWLVFHEAEPSTTGRWVRLARQYLSVSTPTARFGAGTNAYFTHLNRGRPPIDDLDLVCYSINPQVHAFDDASLVEALATQATTVVSARTFCDDVPIAVSPVTLRPRFNPDASGPAPEVPVDGVDEKVDPRQWTLLGAAWTLGSLKYLSESGVDSITYYETAGPCGVMERTLPGAAGEVFPLFHVLADVSAFVGGLVVPSRSSDPLLVDGLVLTRDGATRILLANFSAVSQQVWLQGIAGIVRLRILDDSTLDRYRSEEVRVQSGESLESIAGEVSIELPPYAIACIDGAWAY